MPKKCASPFSSVRKQLPSVPIRRLVSSLALAIVALCSVLFSATAAAQVANCPFAVGAAPNALGSALLLSRHARQLTGAALATGSGVAPANQGAVQQQFQANLTRMDLDGDGVFGTYDAVVAARVLLGLSTTSAVANVTPSAAGTRTTAAAVKTFLDAGCPAPVGATPLVSYNFPAGDTLADKNGWSFFGKVGDVALSPIPGLSANGLGFRYPASAVTAASYDNSACSWVEQPFSMPPSDEFFLEFRLHVPVGYKHRNDTGLNVESGSVANWQIGDRVQSTDGLSEATLSGIDGQMIFLRNADSEWSHDKWGANGTIRNVTRNLSISTTRVGRIESNRKLMAIYADDYSWHGLGPTIVWEYWQDNAGVAAGETPVRSTLAFHYSPGGHTSANSHDQYMPFISPSDFGKYIDIMLHGKFSSVAGAQDGVIETWLRRQGEVGYTRIHQKLDADLTKRGTDDNPGTLVPWQRGKMLGWANACFDQDTTLHVSRVNYYTARPAGI